MTIFGNSRVVLTLSKRKAGLPASYRTFFCPDFATEDPFLVADDKSGSYQRMRRVDESKSDLPPGLTHSKYILSISSRAAVALLEEEINYKDGR